MIYSAQNILVLTINNPGKTTAAGGFLEVIWLLFICIFVIGASFFVTKYVGGIQQKKQKNSVFELLDACTLGNHKHLQLFKAGSRYFIVAVSKDTVTYIAELNEDEIPFKKQDMPKGSFSDIFLKLVNRKNKNLPDKAEVPGFHAEQAVQETNGSESIAGQAVQEPENHNQDIENNSKG